MLLVSCVILHKCLRFTSLGNTIWRFWISQSLAVFEVKRLFKDSFLDLLHWSALCIGVYEVFTCLRCRVLFEESCGLCFVWWWWVAFRLCIDPFYSLCLRSVFYSVLLLELHLPPKRVFVRTDIVWSGDFEALNVIDILPEAPLRMYVCTGIARPLILHLQRKGCRLWVINWDRGACIVTRLYFRSWRDRLTWIRFGFFRM
jgi:hypothetical protein